MNTKKTLSVILAIIMIFTSISVSIAIADETAYSYVVYDEMSGNTTSTLESSNMKIIVNGGTLTKFTNYASGYNCAQWQHNDSNISLTFELKNVAAGDYTLKVVSVDHTSGYRGVFDITANETFLKTEDFAASSKQVVEHNFDTVFTADGTNNVSVKFEVNNPEGRTSKQIFIHSIMLIKSGSSSGTTIQTSETSSATTTPTTTITTTTTTTSSTPSSSGTYTNCPTEYFSSNINSSTGTTTKTSSDGSYSFTAEYGLANYSSSYINGLNVLQWQPAETGKLTFTFNNVEPAVYKITINSADHLEAYRSFFDVTVNDTFDSTIDFVAAGKSYISHELANTLTLNNKGTVTIQLTNNIDMNTQNSRTTRQTVIESVVLTKLDDVFRDPLYVETNMKKGASIRLSDNNGIRFYTQVDTNAIDALIADGATVELGTLIAPADLLDGNELNFNIEKGKYVDVKYNIDLGYYENNNTFVGSIVNIKETNTAFNTEKGNIARPFVGRGYVKVTKDNDTYINYAKYYDYNETNNTRSLAYVSLMLQSDTDKYSSLDDSLKNIVDSWASKYGEITVEHFKYTTLNYQGTQISDNGAIMLPKNYTDEGKPVRLVIDCHGYSATINESSFYYGRYPYLDTLVHDGYAVLVAVENAYHMGTPFAVDSYINAYKYVIENYNVYDEVYVNGNSMGGITSINLVCSGEIPVIAHSLQYPVTSITHQLYYNEWTSSRKSIANYYNFDYPNDENGTAYDVNTFPFTTDVRTFGSTAELQLLEDNFFDKIAPAKSVYRFTNIMNSEHTAFASGFEDFISCTDETRLNEMYSNMTIDYPVPVLVQHCLDDGSVRCSMTKYFVNSIKNGNGEDVTAIYYNGSKHGGDIGNETTYLAKDGETLSVRESSVEITKFITNIENSITEKQ
ncbi:MAG: alpha/beta hydrolase family protein [Acutalibacteraceae bacterium]